MTNSKAQGLSINMIILIALGLIVLIILSVMFYRTAKGGNQTITACENLNGKCIPTTECGTSDQVNRIAKCSEGEVCCIKATG